jgi:GMP reductase
MTSKFYSNQEMLDYSDVLIVPCAGDVSSRSEVDLTTGAGVVPIIAANMDGVGTFEMARALAKHKMLTALVKHYSLEELIEFFKEDDSRFAFYSMGISNEDIAKYHDFIDAVNAEQTNVPFGVCIDVANGYTENFLDKLDQIVDICPSMFYMAGNVVTPEQVYALSQKGIDIIKVGIGPGSVCTTRKMTGVGFPQFSAVLDCAKTGIGTCADGGITCAGDVAKGFGAGASYVMIGGMFAGHEEGLPSEHKDKVEYMSNVPFYGMASKAAQELHNGGVADYRASEGKEVILKYKGPVEKTVQEILGGLRSACTYVGARNLYELAENSQFIRVNRQLNNVFGVS